MGIHVIHNNGRRNTLSSATSQYTGEKTGGELNAMPRYGTDPNEFIKQSYAILSDRNATLYHTSALARACVNKPLSYSIGDGILFRSQPNAKMMGMEKDEAKEWANQFTTLLHYEKLAVGYYEKQALLVRDAKITGDSVLFFLREPGVDIPFDLIASGGHIIDSTKSDSAYTLGVKLDQYARRSGFWATTTQTEVPFVSADGTRNAIQMMYKERPGQVRGNGAYYSEIARSKNLDRVWDAVVERMVQEASILGYSAASDTNVKRQIQSLAGDSVKVGKNLAASTNGSIQQIATEQMNTGGFLHLKNDEEMNFLEMKSPSNNFGMANEWAINMFGMASGYSPEFLMGKYSTSFTAHKGSLNDTWKKIKQDRATFIHTVDRMVNLEYLNYFIANGQIEAPKDYFTSRSVRLASLGGKYLGPVPGHINPLQEVNADLKADAAGYTLKSDIATKYGNNFEDMIEQWGEEQDQWSDKSPEFQAKTIEETSQA